MFSIACDDDIMLKSDGVDAVRDVGFIGANAGLDPGGAVAFNGECLCNAVLAVFKGFNAGGVCSIRELASDGKRFKIGIFYKIIYIGLGRESIRVGGPLSVVGVYPANHSNNNQTSCNQ